jgi:hypothetical protein
VNDFPPVGQREYHAKSSQYQNTAQSSSPSRIHEDDHDVPQPRRGGIFKRLVASGLGRSADDSQSDRRRFGSDRSSEEKREQLRANGAPPLPVFLNKNKE